MWIILSSSTSNDENVKPNNKFFQESTRKPRAVSKGTTQNEDRQIDFL